MEENKNELMLWVGIMAIIGLFIFFMPDIERFIFGQPKKDKSSSPKTEEKVVKPEKKAKKETKSAFPSSYECVLTKTESFYNENINYRYTYDKSGNTLTVSGNDTVVVNSVDSYNQMKTTYSESLKLFDKLDAKFKDYYTTNIEYDDANRTIKLTSNVTDYANAMKIINDYNKAHENESITLKIYKTYDETEINMKSDGYICK